MVMRQTSSLLDPGGNQAPKKPPALGIVAALMVVACVALFPLSIFHFYSLCDQTLGSSFGIIKNLEEMRSTESFSVALAWGIGLIVSGVGALTGFALSVAAASMKRGFVFGVLGIILSFLTTFLAFLALVEVSMAHGHY